MLGLRITSAIASLILLAPSAPAQSGSGLMGPLTDDGGQTSLSIHALAPESSGDSPTGASAPARHEAAIPLGAPKLSELLPTIDQDADASPTAEIDRPLGGSESDTEALASSAVRTVGALTLVIALIVGLAMVYKRFSGGRGGLLGRVASRGPSGLCEVLARYPLPPRHSLVVLRFGQRVLLLSHPVKGGEMTTLCELTDPGEIAGVLEIVRQSSGQSINARFRDAIAEADRQFESAMLRGRAAPYAQPLSHGSRFRQAAVSPDGDRAELLGDLHASQPDPRTPSPLRRRLESLRGGGIA